MSLNSLPTGGEVAAPAGSDSCSPSLTHQGLAASVVSCRNKGKAWQASGKLMVKAPGES